MNILAIDPGKHNGVASFHGGKIEELNTYTAINLIKLLGMIRTEIYGIAIYDMVVIEDSRMQSFIYQPNAIKSSKAKAMSIARDIGGIDKMCEIIQAICHEKGIPIISVSPKKKGKKLNAKEFEAVTGWSAKSNCHERDAAMVGWAYRNAAIMQ